MNLTQKDKITLSILAIVLALFIGVWFILKPAWQEVQESKKDYNELRKDYTALESQVKQIDTVKQGIQTKYDECIKLAEPFYDDATDYALQDEVYNQLESVGITVTSNTVSHGIKLLSAYRYKETFLDIPSSEYADINPDVETNNGIPAIAPQTVGCYTFNIEFKDADKDKIFEFVENLKTYDHKTMVVTSLSFEVNEFDVDEEDEEDEDTNPEDSNNENNNAPQPEEVELGTGKISLELYYMMTPEKPILD